MPGYRQRVTIKQVAKEAGVSTQTVSRVLNERPDVAPDTRQRVQDVIDRLQYKPSAVARSLIRQQSNMLGVVTAGLNYIGPSRTLNGITNEAEQLGFMLLLEELPGFSTIDIQPILDNLLARQVDGIIWAVPEIGDNHDVFRVVLPEITIPIIFLSTQASPDWHVVTTNNRKGGRIATEHLLSAGHRKIAHLAGPSTWWEATERRVGWREAMVEAGFAAIDEQIAEGNWSAASGDRAFEQLYEQFPQMTALFAGNDQMALGAIHRARRLGIRVPEELAVVGFDGLSESAYFSPPLTTIYHDQQQLGCIAVREVVRLIGAAQNSDENQESLDILVEPQLIVRESSGVIPVCNHKNSSII
ncbi:MAG: LacI family DNA-binding transcriptional regulator [Caldilineales bacterium]|nr:LacI family DNA-binding transcriptional regulator [Caldilineales bacterium]